MATNRQKRATRIRQKMQNRQPSKASEIRKLQARVDALPINMFTGEVIWPKTEEKK